MTWQQSALNLLAHAGVGGTAFLVAGCLGVRCCRQPVHRIRIIELTLVGTLLLPFASVLPWLPRWSVGWLRVESPATEDVVGSNTSQPRNEPAPTQDISGGPRPAVALRDKSETSACLPQAGSSAKSSQQPPTPAQPAASSPRFSLTTLVLVAYGMAICLLLLHVCLGLLRLAWLCHSSVPAPEPAPTLLRAMAGPLARRVSLRASNAIELPVMFAAPWPVILLPARLCRHDEVEALRFCLAHEWSHVECGDARRWYLAELIRFLFFWHPLFLWLRRQLRLCQDYLADARAAAEADASDYAGFLITLARRRLAEPALALGIQGGRSDLYWRMHMLLQPRFHLERRCVTTWSLAAAVTAVLLFLGVAAVRLDASAPAASEQTVDKPASNEQPPENGETLHYSGRVTDKDTGKPIAGATVVVRRSLLGDPEQKETTPVIQETKHTTDADGKYSFVIPPEQTAQRYLYIELDVEHPDYAWKKRFGYALSMIRKNEKVGGRPFFEHVELRPGKPVSGIVQTLDGKPAPGVKLLAFSLTTKTTGMEFEYGSFADCRTDREGKFRLMLTTPGQAVFWILPEAYAPSLHAVPANKRGDLGTFTLEDGIRLKGKVVDTKGNPVAGVNVNAEKADQSEELQGLHVADSMCRSAVTGSNGEFAMMPLPPGNYRVKPDEFPREESGDVHVRRPVPESFLPQKVAIKAGMEPEPLELRAVPSVIVEAQHYDSSGKPSRGHGPTIFGQIDKDFWFFQAKSDANGKVVFRAPHGLEHARLRLMTNEHGALRWRKGKDEPLHNNNEIDLGTLNDDVKGIEVIRYVAPILLAKVKTSDGSVPEQVKVTAMYANDKKVHSGSFIVGDGLNSDVHFERQPDGRFRSECLLPDEQVTLSAHADGYRSVPLTVSVPEKETKLIELILEKDAAKKVNK